MGQRLLLASSKRSPADRAMLIALIVWALWAITVSAMHEDLVPGGLRVAIVPLIVMLGIMIGRRCVNAGWAAAVVAVGGGTALIMLFADLMYTNAQAAFGVQLVAAAGLVLTGGSPGRVRESVSKAGLFFGILAGTVGVLLAAGAQATILLVLVTTGAVAVSAARSASVGPYVLVAIGLASIAASIAAVLVLGSLRTWPDALDNGDSLSWARHGLWRDAIELWRLHPVAGGGPGSFLEFSGTARSAPHLYAAHSSLLQVASELGAVGAVLFLAVLIAGVVLAASGDRARGLIGVAAWSALAVHSMIDHLYEFPLVCLLAGVVIGWAGTHGDADARDEGWRERSRAGELA